MTTHSQPDDFSRSFLQRHSTRGASEKSASSDSSENKTKLIGTIAAAFITAVFGTVTAVILDHNDAQTTPTQPIPFNLVQSSDRGSVDSVTVSDSRTALALSGWANPYVDAVGVVIFEPKTQKPISTEITDVADGKWSLVATTDSRLPEPVGIMAAYNVGVVTKSSTVTFKLDPPTPSPQPGQSDACTAESLDSCFTGPGWGTPSIYQTK